jgi:hypothetical protein
MKGLDTGLKFWGITGCLICLLAGCAEPVIPTPGSTTHVSRAVFAGVVGETHWIGALTVSLRNGKIVPGASTFQLANGKRFQVASGSGLSSFIIDLDQQMRLQARGTLRSADLYVGTFAVRQGQQTGPTGKWSASVLHDTTIDYAFHSSSPPTPDYSGALVLQGNAGRLLLPDGEIWPAASSPWHGRPNSLLPPVFTVTVNLGHTSLVCQGHLTASDTVGSFSGTFRDPGTGARRTCSGNLLSFPTSSQSRHMSWPVTIRPS